MRVGGRLCKEILVEKKKTIVNKINYIAKTSFFATASDGREPRFLFFFSKTQSQNQLENS